MQPLEDEKKMIQACLDHAPYAWEQFVDCYSPVVIGALQSLEQADSATDNTFPDIEEMALVVFGNLQKNDYETLRQFRFESSFHAFLIVHTHQTAIQLRSGA